MPMWSNRKRKEEGGRGRKESSFPLLLRQALSKKDYEEEGWVRSDFNISTVIRINCQDAHLEPDRVETHKRAKFFDAFPMLDRDARGKKKSLLQSNKKAVSPRGQSQGRWRTGGRRKADIFPSPLYPSPLPFFGHKGFLFPYPTTRRRRKRKSGLAEIQIRHCSFPFFSSSKLSSRPSAKLLLC